MSKQQNSRSDDWTRCSEGFLGLSSTSNVKQKERKSVFDSFSGHGNIFEKLGLAPEEESSKLYKLLRMFLFVSKLFFLQIFNKTQH